jgi:hypothetical protein
MDSRSAYEPLENNKQLVTVSRPSTGSADHKNIKADSEKKMKKEPPIQVIHVKDEGKKDKNMEFRAVETIEEFFRPELAKQDDMNS